MVPNPEYFSMVLIEYDESQGPVTIDVKKENIIIVNSIRIRS